MKLQAVLSTVLFATTAALSITVQAAETDNATPSVEAKADQGTQASQPATKRSERLVCKKACRAG